METKWTLVAIGQKYDYYRAAEEDKFYFQCSIKGKRPSEECGGVRNLPWLFNVKCDRLIKFVD